MDKYNKILADFHSSALGFLALKSESQIFFFGEDDFIWERITFKSSLAHTFGTKKSIPNGIRDLKWDFTSAHLN